MSCKFRWNNAKNPGKFYPIYLADDDQLLMWLKKDKKKAESFYTTVMIFNLKTLFFSY